MPAMIFDGADVPEKADFNAAKLSSNAWNPVTACLPPE
jgi:hypothetical protein